MAAGVKSGRERKGRQAPTPVTPELVRAVADRVYARLLREWQLERERRGAGASDADRPGGMR